MEVCFGTETEGLVGAKIAQCMSLLQSCFAIFVYLVLFFILFYYTLFLFV